jgi:hypothetical protein
MRWSITGGSASMAANLTSRSRGLPADFARNKPIPTFHGCPSLHAQCAMLMTP